MFDADEVKKALDFAAQAHGDQKVPGSGVPYVVHLTKVALEMAKACALDPSLDSKLGMSAAFLHDCMEDAEVPMEKLVTEFGARIARGVAALSKRGDLPKEERMKDSLKRLQDEPREIKAVKLADRITNLEPPPAHWDREKRAKYAEQALEILEALRGSCLSLEKRLEEKHAIYLSYVDKGAPAQG